MGNISSKPQKDEIKQEDHEKMSIETEDKVKTVNPKGMIDFISSKVPEFNKDVYLPKTNSVENMKLQDLEGVFTVLYFYPGDFELEVMPEISALKKNAESGGISNFNLLGVSTDSVEAHEAFSVLEQSQGGLKGTEIALISDRTGDLCKFFQVYDESNHSAFPSFVILDPEVKIVSKTIFDRKIGGDAVSVLNILKYLMNKDVNAE